MNSKSAEPQVTRLRRRWIVPLLCWLALVVDGYDIIIYGSTLPAIIGNEAWGVTTQSAALVGSLSMIGVAVGAVASGLMTDLFGRRKLFMISLALFSIAALGCAVASNFAVFGFWRVVSGLGVGGILPTIVALAAEFSKPEKRSRTVGLVMTGPLVGGLLGSYAALATLESAGFRPIYALGAIALVTILPVAMWHLPESAAFLRSRGRDAEADRVATMYGVDAGQAVSAQATKSRVPIGILFEGRSRWVTPGLWLMMFICMLLTYTILTWLPQMMVAGGMELEVALRFFVFFNIAAVAGTAAWAFLADRIGPKRVVTAGLSCGVLGFVFLAVGNQSWVAIGVLVAGFGTGSSFSYLLDHIAGYYPPEVRASGLGWASGFGRLAGIAGPSYGGLFVSVGAGDVSIVAWALAVPAAVGALLMSTLPRDGSNPRPTGAESADEGNVEAISQA